MRIPPSSLLPILDGTHGIIPLLPFNAANVVWPSAKHFHLDIYHDMAHE